MRITAWRIVKKAYLDSAFTGEGSSRFPGRWNPRGVAVVYTAGSLSLAAMEMLVHLENEEVLDNYFCVSASFDERMCRHLRREELPDDWMRDPAPKSTREIGRQWAAGERSLVLAVPSVVIPIETTFLLNPRHARFEEVEIGDPQPFRFDPRLHARRL